MLQAKHELPKQSRWYVFKSIRNSSLFGKLYFVKQGASFLFTLHVTLGSHCNKQSITVFSYFLCLVLIPGSLKLIVLPVHRFEDLIRSETFNSAEIAWDHAMLACILKERNRRLELNLTDCTQPHFILHLRKWKWGVTFTDPAALPIHVVRGLFEMFASQKRLIPQAVDQW